MIRLLLIVLASTAGIHAATLAADSACHGLTEAIKPGVKPVSQWAGLADPIALTEGMWNHLPSMWAALEVKRVRWPQLTGQDLADLLVYMRNLPGTRENGGVFETSAGAKGADIFKSKGCFGCGMNCTAIGWPPFDGREMSDLTTYLNSRDRKN